MAGWSIFVFERETRLQAAAITDALRYTQESAERQTNLAAVPTMNGVDADIMSDHLFPVVSQYSISSPRQTFNNMPNGFLITVEGASSRR